MFGGYRDIKLKQEDNHKSSIAFVLSLAFYDLHSPKLQGKKTRDRHIFGSRLHQIDLQRLPRKDYEGKTSVTVNVDGKERSPVEGSGGKEKEKRRRFGSWTKDKYPKGGCPIWDIWDIYPMIWELLVQSWDICLRRKEMFTWRCQMCLPFAKGLLQMELSSGV